MARAIYQSVAVDDEGNEVKGVTVRVTEEPGGTEAVGLFTSRSGTTVKPNPFTTPDDTGAFSFFAPGGAYRITITKGSFTRTLNYVAIGTAAEKDLAALISSGTTWYGASTGTGAAYVVADNGFTPADFEASLRVRFRVHVANTGAGTLKTGALPIRPLVKQGNSPLVQGDLPVGHIAIADFDTVLDKFILINPFVAPPGPEFAKLNVENQALTGGAAVTSKDLGTLTSGTLTLDMGDRPQQHYINGGAHALAPGAVNGACLLDVTNNASAGAITTSGWTFVNGSFDTTDGNDFRCHCSVANGRSLLIIQAMQ